jgi:replicative DNA helicase
MQRVPPNDISAEVVTLGSMILSPEAIAKAREIVTAEDFYRPAHGMIFAAILELADSGSPVDLVTLPSLMEDKAQLKPIGGIDYLDKVLEGTPSAANAEYYAKIVRDKAARREVISLAIKAQDTAYEDQRLPVTEIVGQTQDALHNLGRRLVDVSSECDLSAASGEIMKRLEDAFMNGMEVSAGISTGFDRFDKSFGGLRKGHLITLAGATGSGKSTLALNIASNVADQGHSVLYVSAEMTCQELATRLLQSRAGVWGSRMIDGKLTPDDWNRLTEADGVCRKHKIYLCGRALDLAGIAQKARDCRTRWYQDIGLIVIDYLGIMRMPHAREMRERFTLMTGGLKRLAMMLDCPIMMLSQLNRDGVRDGKPPSLYSLKESGSIENDSNEVILLHCPQPNQILTEQGGKQYVSVWASVAKARDGETTKWKSQSDDGIVLAWTPGQTLFQPWS